MAILVQFLLRLSFGLAFGMAITSSRQVTSGFFRNHLYVTFGLTVLAALVSYSAAPDAYWWAVAAAVASYVGSVCWLYEKKRFGWIAIVLVALCTLNGSLESSAVSISDYPYSDKYYSIPAVEDGTTEETLPTVVDRPFRLLFLSLGLTFLSDISSGLLVGLTLAAMLLGHWYLNSPTMELAPLRRLLKVLGVAIAFQAAMSAVGLACELHYTSEFSVQFLLFVVLRWSFGLVGVAALAWMAWQALKTPNTQSATGILYVAVVGAFVGELTGLLLSAESAFPL